MQTHLCAPTARRIALGLPLGIQLRHEQVPEAWGHPAAPGVVPLAIIILVLFILPLARHLLPLQGLVFVSVVPPVSGSRYEAPTGSRAEG